MKQRITCLLYDIILFIVRCYPARSSTVPKLAIVKTDEIGDFILWRNCLPLIQRSARFKNHNITIIGNAVWKSIFDRFDGHYTHNCIWIDKKKFKSNLVYRFKLLLTVKRRGFTIVINAIYSRSKRVDDAFVIAASGSLNIGYIAEETNLLPYEKGYDKDLFDELFEVNEPNQFDYERNLSFTAWLLREHITVPEFGFQRLLLGAPGLKIPGQSFYIVFPGSGNATRVWRTENFVRIADSVHRKYKLLPVVCGGPGDVSLARAFTEHYNGACLDMSGRLSLPDFLYFLSKSSFLISVDTGSVHMAASVRCPVFGLFNGSQYGRFAPYPKRVFDAFYAIYPDSIEDELSKKKSHYSKNVPIDYNLIDADKVMNKIDEFFARKAGA